MVRKERVNKYLLIPHYSAPKTDSNLQKVMDLIAKRNGAKNAKFYFSKRLGCSKKTIKLMTITKYYPRVMNWSLNEYPDRDTYRDIKRVATKEYVEMIRIVIEEFHQVDDPLLREEFIAVIAAFRIEIIEYKDVFCYQTVEGAKSIVHNDITAVRVNRNENISLVAEHFLDALRIAEVEF